MPQEQDELIARLRAVVKPLLDEPLVADWGGMCVFCHGQYDHEHGLPGLQHADDCPVLHPEELMGHAADRT
jgi:hypothetical protein